jgi:hypothetical protein
MKARIPTPLERQSEQRRKGRDLIRSLRDKGIPDSEICRKLGVPESKWLKFLWQIGMPFDEWPKKESEEKKS